MRWIALPLCAIALVACSKSESSAGKDTAAAAAAAAATPVAAAPAKLALADVAGKWNVKATNQAGDTTLVTYVMTATADTAGWNIQFTDRKTPLPMHVVADADSLIIDAGPYSSALRKNVQVTTHGSLHMQNGMLVGMTTAHYSVKTADSVRMVKMEATRMP
jgi:hypothetical protein